MTARAKIPALDLLPQGQSRTSLVAPPGSELLVRPRDRRGRARELQARMLVFSTIYNAGYMVRDAYFGPDERRQERVMEFIAVMLQEMRRTDDLEALLFAVADALYASPLGVPWEP